MSDPCPLSVSVFNSINRPGLSGPYSMKRIGRGQSKGMRTNRRGRTVLPNYLHWESMRFIVARKADVEWTCVRGDGVAIQALRLLIPYL